MIHIRCECGKAIDVPAEHFGKAAACPKCRRPIRVVAPDHGDRDPVRALLVVDGPVNAGERIYLGGRGPIHVGKLPDSDIRLTGKKVSRKHGRLVRLDSGWHVEDLQSTNGVHVNGERTDAQVLKNGDTVRIGEFHLRFSEVPTTEVVTPQAGADARSPGPATEPETADDGPLPPADENDDGPLPLADEDDGLFMLADEVDVPAAAPSVPVPAPKPRPICPSCRETLGPGAKICIACGIDLKTGRPLLTAHEADVDEIYVRAEGLIRVISWLFFMGVYPIASEAFGTRKPHVIRALALITVVCSVAFWVAAFDAPNDSSLKNLLLWTGDADVPIESVIDPAVLSELDPDVVAMLREEVDVVGAYRPSQLITHAFLHGDPIHLAGNLLFLLVLGSRVNALIGNIGTAIVYPMLAVAGAVAHMQATADRAPTALLGASGAVMGLAGMYLVFFPVHNVHMAAWFRWGLIWGFRLSLRLFTVRGFWVVLFYMAFDVFYVVLGIEDGVAHWAHLGGFLTGVAIAVILLVGRIVDGRGGDLISALLGRPAFAATRRAPVQPEAQGR